MAGLFLAFCALGLIAIAISTDNWYETDARRHRERCKNYSNKRNDPGYIYISNNNLPLRKMPRDKDVSGGGATPLRAKRHILPPASAMESHCSRQYNSTITGLWRKCHREGFDLETEDLIFKGLASREKGVGVFCVHLSPFNSSIIYLFIYFSSGYVCVLSSLSANTSSAGMRYPRF